MITIAVDPSKIFAVELVSQKYPEMNTGIDKAETVTGVEAKGYAQSFIIAHSSQVRGGH